MTKVQMGHAVTRGGSSDAALEPRMAFFGREELCEERQCGGQVGSLQGTGFAGWVGCNFQIYFKVVLIQHWMKFWILEVL